MVLGLLACGPYGAWPDDETVFPWVYTPEEGLPAYADVRFETETWSLEDDPELAGYYLLKAASHRTSAPVESLAHFDQMRAAIPPLADGPHLSFAGDVMWLGENWEDALVPAAGLLDGDVRVGNLETPVAPSFPTDLQELPLYAFNAPVEYLDALPFDALQLNNNHALDVGDEGLTETVEQVALAGYVGTGVDTHAVVDLAGEPVALLSYTWGLNHPETPTTHELFVVPFGHLDEDIDLQRIADDVAEARAAGRRAVVMVHWGYEYEYYADPHFLVLGRRLVALGADLVVGSGPHVVQPPELCYVNHPDVVPGVGTCSVRTDDGVSRTAAVLYSLGNFATMNPTVPVQVGIVGSVSFDEEGVSGLGWEAAVSRDGTDGRRVYPLADHLDDPDLAQESARLDAHLGVGWKR